MGCLSFCIALVIMGTLSWIADPREALGGVIAISGTIGLIGSLGAMYDYHRAGTVGWKIPRSPDLREIYRDT